MHTGIVAGAFACLFGLISAASAATVTLTMDQDPQQEGWWLWKDGGSHSVANGFLHVEAPQYYEFFAPADVWVDQVSNARGWTVEARLRRDPSSTGTPGMWIDDGRYLTLFGLGSSGLQLGEGSDFIGGYAVDTSVFHTYRFQGKNDGLSVFIDDALALSLNPTRPFGGTFSLSFGDNNAFTTPGNSVADWDYVSMTTTPIPLPAGVWLLGSALLALGGIAARRTHA